MKTTHKLIAANSRNGTIFARWAVYENGKRVAVMCNESLSSEREMELAQQFAAAPELLDALTDAYRELVADDIVTKVLREEHHLPHTENPVLEKIRAAIARATQS